MGPRLAFSSLPLHLSADELLATDAQLDFSSLQAGKLAQGWRKGERKIIDGMGLGRNADGSAAQLSSETEELIPQCGSRYKAGTWGSVEGSLLLCQEFTYRAMRLETGCPSLPRRSCCRPAAGRLYR